MEMLFVGRSRGQIEPKSAPDTSYTRQSPRQQITERAKGRKFVLVHLAVCTSEMKEPNNKPDGEQQG